MNSSRTKMVATISRVGTKQRIKCLLRSKRLRVKELQERLGSAVSKEREEWIKDQIMELVYPHILHEQREHSKPVDPYEETEF